MKQSQPCPRCGGKGFIYDDREVGAEMRANRKRAGVSITEAAKAMAFSKAYLSDLELGQRHWTGFLIQAYIAAVNNIQKQHEQRAKSNGAIRAKDSGKKQPQTAGRVLRAERGRKDAKRPALRAGDSGADRKSVV